MCVTVLADLTHSSSLSDYVNLLKTRNQSFTRNCAVDLFQSLASQRSNELDELTRPDYCRLAYFAVFPSVDA